MNKKLQVFISSTYTDLIDERQAAVEAILDTGHIPAGMELFKAGNESQLKTIQKWIDESDVYMLILGGRYGSVEPNSGKSYTQLEYEYALSKNIPVFSVVLSESFLSNKIKESGLLEITEQKEPNKYQLFKELVMSKIIREVDDCKDIKITIYSTLNEFMNKYTLTGWSRYNDDNSSIQLSKDNDLLSKQNSLLNSQLNNAELIINKLNTKIKLMENDKYGEYYFTRLIKIFKAKHFPIFVNGIFPTSISALNLFIEKYNDFCNGTIKYSLSFSTMPVISQKYFLENAYQYFENFQLIRKGNRNGKNIYKITKLGECFYKILQAEL